MKILIKLIKLIWSLVVTYAVLSYWNARDWVFWTFYGIVFALVLVGIILAVSASYVVVRAMVTEVDNQILNNKDNEGENQSHSN